MPRRFFVESLRSHRRRHEVGDAGRCLARAEKQHGLLVNLLAGDAQRGEESRERHGRGALDIIVEHAGAIAVFLEQPERILVGEVLELDDHAREHLLRGGHEFLDQVIVGLSAQAALAQAHVERIAQELAVVRARVYHHRQAQRRVHARARRVKRELADRNAHAVGTEVAETQNALAVGDHDQARFMRPVAQHRRDVPAVVGRNENAARPLENHAEFLAREAYARRIDDRLHLVDVIADNAKEQRLVAVVQRVQGDVFFQRIGQTLQRPHETRDLLLLRRDVRRE